MKTYIKFVMSKGDPITVDEPQAHRILTSPQQIHPVKDENGVWTHETINKAFVVATAPDYERMKLEAANERDNAFKLSAPPLTEEQIAKNLGILRQMKEKIFGKKFASKRLDNSRV